MCTHYHDLLTMVENYAILRSIVVPCSERGGSMYTELARIVHYVHLLIIVFGICGFFVAIIPKFYRFRAIYFTFLLMTVLSQVICSWRCPIVLLEMYLFEIEHPGTVNDAYYKPFIVEFLKSSFKCQTT